ncbi:GDSL-type esterase/lipase family protein [Paenibacillus montanisoli]|uniref:SGNH hydrolase-type esterase domain-containing protein n=1 Tax=Paenibacillus montanisoli TaxID=2081970 RepID=A0A328U1G1_9BACL|nr:GDSL-type esterase/lipase family protein [Paenibacillus montanisoli]RAP76607.1 hypothetical protein DL346_14685 [Paenibacillus montanisoli]
MLKKMAKTIAVTMIAGALLSSTAWASSDQERKQLVALGDSITYGYNLGADNESPSAYAFPYLMEQDAKLHTIDLAFPGWTSAQLLQAVQNDKEFRQNLKHAEYITLDIGNNDLLNAIGAATNADGSLNIVQLQTDIFLNVMPKFISNLKQTIVEIRSLSDARIAVYNIYNPYQEGHPLHFLSESLLKQIINNQLAGAVQSLGFTGIVIADAYTAFNGKQDKFVIGHKGDRYDVHPTIDGQRALAEIGADALDF